MNIAEVIFSEILNDAANPEIYTAVQDVDQLNIIMHVYWIMSY